jgi:hypothetical protein
MLGTWALGGFEGMSAVGVFSLLMGEIVGVGVGVGLMTLVFYSDSSEQDDAVCHLGEERLDRQPANQAPTLKRRHSAHRLP